MRGSNLKVAAHTMPMYEHREMSWWEQWRYTRKMERHITSLLYKDYTLHITIILSLAVVAFAVIAGLLIVR